MGALGVSDDSDDRINGVRINGVRINGVRGINGVRVRLNVLLSANYKSEERQGGQKRL